MAFTVSTVVQGVSLGNLLTKVLNVTADAATGNVSTGMKSIAFAQVTSVSAPTGCMIMENTDTSGTAANGTLGMSNCTSGNKYRVVVFGN